jgi:hemerythrin-like domain-containing protein
MMPIAPLMIEHRLIERMIAVIKKETEKCKLEGRINSEFIDLAVDFIRTYADRCHHGKEEDILFRDLDKKPLSVDQRDTTEELIEEHKQGRETVVKIVAAKTKYENGDTGALTITPATIELNFRHSGESRNPLRRLDAGSSPA